MKLIIRKTNINDLDKVYNLHIKCFNVSEQWYKRIISQYLDNSFVVCIKDTNDIIGLLLQGDITPCSSNDIFEPINKEGEIFLNSKFHLKELYGIVMICVDPSYQGLGLGKKLINKHFKDNNNKVVCLNTRKSNNAFHLYKSMGYQEIAYIKDKYYLPTEDSIFMIKDLNN